MKKTNLIFSLLLLAGIFLTSNSFKTQGYKVGDKATDFSLKNIDGKMLSLKDYTDAKGFIVIFTCNHCPYAIANEDRIIALQSKYGKEYPVIAINPNDTKQEPDDSFDKMQARAKTKGFNFAYLYDESQIVAKAFGATKTPHVYLLDKSLVVKYIGAIDDSSKDEKNVKTKFLENAIENLKSGKKVEVETTKAIGCGIKWKNI